MSSHGSPRQNTEENFSWDSKGLAIHHSVNHNTFATGPKMWKLSYYSKRVEWKRSDAWTTGTKGRTLTVLSTLF